MSNVLSVTKTQDNIAFKLLPPTNEVWGKVILSVACVKNSVHRGVCLSACWDTDPLARQTPWKGAPPPPSKADPLARRYPLARQQTPLAKIPPAQCMVGDTVNKRAVCILLECDLVN